MMLTLLLFFVGAVDAGCPFSAKTAGAGPCPFRSLLQVPAAAAASETPTTLRNGGKACWAHCDRKAGDCLYCGTGQCCRKKDYDASVPGCELAHDVTAATCGAFKAESYGLKNQFEACMGHCGNTPGDCTYCGTGQCCRRIDGERCVPGCELAATNWVDGPGSQCNNFQGPAATCEHTRMGGGGGGAQPTSTRSSTTTSSTTTTTTTNSREGLSCWSQCAHGEQNAAGIRGGECEWCGDPELTCCTRNDWYRGVEGCELAEHVTQAVCGRYRRRVKQPDDFRTSAPRGTVPTPRHTPTPGSATVPVSGWLRDLDTSDQAVPAYDGEGGQPWSPYEMALVRDLILREIRKATTSRDQLSSAKFLRLGFHDCLQYAGGEGGCDGCLNWMDVGSNVRGTRGGNGRVEDREFEDHERRASNNGLQDVVAFLEHIYTLDLGKTWAGGCWQTPATVVSRGDVLGDTQKNPIFVTSIGECQEHCRNLQGCAYFTVPTTGFLGGRGPCRLFGEAASPRLLSRGRLVAGRVNCLEPSWSLQSRGKSRADLWAFGTLVAVEEGIQRHNWACDGDRRGPYNGPRMCTQFEGEPGCKIYPSRALIFRTGRKDCETTLEPPYKAEKHEFLPDDHFNGTMVVRFMEQHFKFSAKETVAIMGAHTLGKFHQDQTGHKYVWTTDFQAFNNQYYRNLAGKPSWFFDDEDCTKVGDAWGNRGNAVWITKMNQVFKTGAPVQWIKKQVVCPNCAARSYERGGRHADRLAQDRDCCMNGVPEGAQCRPDGMGPPGSPAVDRDDDFSDGCEYSHFIFGRDESALQSDMGLMLKFDVDRRGFPKGCPGLKTFFPSSNRFSDWTCGIDGRPWFVDPSLSFDDPELTRWRRNNWTDRGCPTDCPKQDYRYPGDDLTLAEHVERYADDQAAWIEDFFPTLEKMISNGYGTHELVTSWPIASAGGAADGDVGGARQLRMDESPVLESTNTETSVTDDTGVFSLLSHGDYTAAPVVTIEFLTLAAYVISYL